MSNDLAFHFYLRRIFVHDVIKNEDERNRLSLSGSSTFWDNQITLCDLEELDEFSIFKVSGAPP